MVIFIKPEYRYRIQNLPTEYTEEQLKQDLTKCCSLKPPALSYDINILSFSINDRTDPGTMVAIVSFTIQGSQEETLCLEFRRRVYVNHAFIDLDSEFDGLTPLRLPGDLVSQTDVDIVLVHGLGGHAIKTFTHENGGVQYFWPLEMLSRNIHSAQVWLWGYRSKVVNSISFENLDDLANTFAYFLSGDGPSTQARRAYVLCGVSLGGLIIKKAMPILKDSQLMRVAHLIMLGVPNQGMSIDNLKQIVGEQPNQPLIDSLGPGSQVLYYLRGGFAKAFPFPDSRVYSFYETQYTPQLEKDGDKLKESNKPPIMLVSKESATHGRWEGESGDEFIRAINKNHRNIAKLGVSDPSLKIVMDVMKRCSGDASAIVQQRFMTVLIHNKLFESAGLLKTPNLNQPFRMLTLDLLKKCNEMYEALPHDDHGTVNFDAIRDVLTDPYKILEYGTNYRDQARRQQYYSPIDHIIEQTWTYMKPTTKPLSRNLTLAFFFIISLNQKGISIPQSEFAPLSPPGSTTQFTLKRYRKLIQFDDWTSCQCSQSCPLEWNFANDLGLPRAGNATRISDTGLSSRHHYTPPPFLSTSCDLKAWLDCSRSQNGRKCEKILKKTKDAWYAIRSTSQRDNGKAGG